MTGTALKQQMWRLVTSRPLSTWLLLLVTAVLVLGSLLPNPEYMAADAVADLQARNPLLLQVGKNFNSRKLATGYFFGFIGIYLIISATLCSIDRLIARRRQGGESDPEAGTVGGDIAVFVPAAPPDKVQAFIVARLRRQLFGTAITHDPARAVVIFRRGRFGFWGSIVFHTVLITALVGLVLFSLGGTRGKLVFTEGQRYRLEKARFIHLQKEPLWGLRLPPVELELLTQYSLYAHDDPHTAIDHLAQFRVIDLVRGQSSVREVKINAPLRIEGTDFLLMTGGFAPRFILSSPGGAPLFDSFVSLKREAGTADDFQTAAGLHCDVRFFPNLVSENGQPRTKSLLLHNPAAHLVVTRVGVRLFDDIVPVGGSVQVAGYTLAIPEVRRWVELEMAKEPGIGFFFVVSFFGIFGILVRLLDPDEQLVVAILPCDQGTMVEFSVHSRHFSALLGGVARECAQAAAAWGMERTKGSES